MNERNEKGTKVSLFSISNQTLMYTDKVIMPHSLQKKILKVSHRPSGYVSYEIFDEELHLLAMHGPGHGEND